VRLIDIKIDNFKTFGKGQHVDFTKYSDDEPILIIGENRDEGGMDSNGAGKTTLLDAIAWAIFGRVPDSDSVDDIVHYGETACKVQLRIDDQGKELSIVRARKSGGKSHLAWFIDGEDDTRRTTTQTQQAILNYFGILENNKHFFNDFLNTTYFSMDAMRSFAGKGASNTERIGLISRFLNLAVLDKALGKARVLFNNLKGDIDRLEGRIDLLQGKIEDSLSPEEAQSKLDETRSDLLVFQGEVKNLRKKIKGMEELKDVQSQIDSATEAINMSENQLASLLETYTDQIEQLLKDQKELKNIEAEIQLIVDYLQESDSVSWQARVDLLDDHLSKGTQVLNQISSRVDIIKIQLRKQQSCPECHELLMVDGTGSIKAFDAKTLEDEKIEKEGKQIEVRKKWTKFDTERTGVRARLTEFNEKSRKLSTLNANLARIQEAPVKIERLKEQRKEKKKASAQFVAKQQKVKTTLELRLKTKGGFDSELLSGMESELSLNETKAQKHQEQIGRYEIIIRAIDADTKELKTAKANLQGFLDKQAGYSFWKSGFPAIRRWMIDSFLPAFEEQTNHFLHKMEVSFRVRFDTQREKKSGEMKDEFDISIIDREGNKRPLEGYSGGESKRIGICVGFSLRELTLDRGYSNFNFLLLDEVVDTLDETGIGEFFGLLHSISGMKFVITHTSDLKTRFQRVIKITKEDGISSVKQL
jgi:DNA repair protein SbcC/Rad50